MIFWTTWNLHLGWIDTGHMNVLQCSGITLLPRTIPVSVSIPYGPASCQSTLVQSKACRLLLSDEENLYSWTSNSSWLWRNARSTHGLIAIDSPLPWHAQPSVQTLKHGFGQTIHVYTRSNMLGPSWRTGECWQRRKRHFCSSVIFPKGEVRHYLTSWSLYNLRSRRRICCQSLGVGLIAVSEYCGLRAGALFNWWRPEWLDAQTVKQMAGKQWLGEHVHRQSMHM